MSSFLRKIKRKEEKKEQDNIKNLYHKKPKETCPRCKKKSIFYKNKDGEYYCLRCDSHVKTDY
jgi:hypothetical protein|nr:MAG TPA_asm: TFIIB-TERMINAL DOMAIN, TFIIB, TRANSCRIPTION INITIATION [Caudoviricetes sp.]